VIVSCVPPASVAAEAKAGAVMSGTCVMCGDVSVALLPTLSVTTYS